MNPQKMSKRLSKFLRSGNVWPTQEPISRKFEIRATTLTSNNALLLVKNCHVTCNMQHPIIFLYFTVELLLYPEFFIPDCLQI